MWNVATDLAINSHLMGELPEGGCFPTIKPFEEYPVGMSAEWYFSKLQNDDQFKPQEGDGEGGEGQPSDGQGDGSGNGGLPDTTDDHSGWGEASEEVRDMAKERLKQAVEKAQLEKENKTKLLVRYERHNERLAARKSTDDQARSKRLKDQRPWL